MRTKREFTVQICERQCTYWKTLYTFTCGISLTVIDCLKHHFRIYTGREIQIVEKLSNVLRHILLAKYSQICRVFVIAVGLEL